MTAKSAFPNRRRSRWITIPLRVIAGFVLLSLLLVTLYRFVPPPVTMTML
ncbi:MAG TPA: monofunctional biosynthetic peptidoglycan transglycosylase, partial [Sphingobium sp.]|nr:monofunctional biosynthetic peptidoglycan transglycosylase [Sphingobium sp.]